METRRIAGFLLNATAPFFPAIAGRTGFDLFARPIRRAMKEKERRFLADSEAFSFDAGGERLRGYRWGGGPRRILLLHGWQSNAGRWHVAAPLIERGATVLAMDAPGHGGSGGRACTAPLYAGAVSALVDTEGPFDAVVAHSFGAFALLYAASRYPGLRLGRLAVLATSGDLGEMLAYFRRTLGLGERAVRAIEDRVRKVVGSPVRELNAARFARSLGDGGLIVHDPKDPIAPFRHAELLHEAWPNSVLVAAPGAGHNLNAADVWSRVTDYVLAG